MFLQRAALATTDLECSFTYTRRLTADIEQRGGVAFCILPALQRPSTFAGSHRRIQARAVQHVQCHNSCRNWNRESKVQSNLFYRAPKYVILKQKITNIMDDFAAQPDVITWMKDLSLVITL